MSCTQVTYTLSSGEPMPVMTFSTAPVFVSCPMCPFADYDEEQAALEAANTDESAFRPVEWVPGVGFVIKDK